jgi:hypothetical protein
MGAFKRHGSICSFSPLSFFILCLLCLGIGLSFWSIQHDGTVASLYREPPHCKSQFEPPSTFARGYSAEPPIDPATGSTRIPPYAGKPRKFTKPPSLRIIGLVFYGRKETVEILNCYLQVNFKLFFSGWLS